MRNALVFKWGMKHDAWSFFQSRLVFPSFLSIAFGLGFGYEILERRGTTLRWLVNLALVALYAWVMVYYAVELTEQFLNA